MTIFRNLVLGFFVTLPLFSLYSLPWDDAQQQALPPGRPGTHYTPVVVPNGSTAPWTIEDGRKVFRLTAEVIEWELGEGLTVAAWGYNGSTPGPVLELAAGDLARIYVTNNLPAPTTVHWHGLRLPCGMDGVPGLTQPQIEPGETVVYEFYFQDPGTFMYHSHVDTMTQEAMGLVGMIVVHDRIADVDKRPDRDFVIMLQEWKVEVGAARPNPNEMTDFNILTMNGKVFPDTEPLVAGLDDQVWVRYGNLSAMDHHPIHLHGHRFRIIGTDGGWAPNPDVLVPETTVLVPVGATRVIDFVADNPGDWIFHCHMTHHVMNQMGHAFPNIVGASIDDLTDRIRRLIPGYMPMGTRGMIDMMHMHMAVPENSIPMRGFVGQFGPTVIGGMANVLRVRKGLTDYQDPGPYQFPEGSLPKKVSLSSVQLNGDEMPGVPLRRH